MIKDALESEINILETFAKKGESYTNENGSYGWRNPIRHDTGRILQALVITRKPKRILEIGTAHGLSALYLCSGLDSKSNASLDSIEFDPDVASDTELRFKKLNVPARVITGDALKVIEKLNESYDMVFFDAQKSHYHDQLCLLLQKGSIGPGTIIIADNVIDREDECRPFLDWFITNNILHTIISTECGLLVAHL